MSPFFQERELAGALWFTPTHCPFPNRHFSKQALANLRDNARRNNVDDDKLELVEWNFCNPLPESLRGRGVTHVIGADIWLPSASVGNGLVSGIRNLWKEYDDTLKSLDLVLVWRPNVNFGRMKKMMKDAGLDCVSKQRPWEDVNLSEDLEVDSGESLFWRGWWKWWILPTLQLMKVRPRV